MKRIWTLLAATLVGMAAWADFGPDTIKDDIPGTATVREIVQAGGGGGGGGVDTNAVIEIANEAISTNALMVATTNSVGALWMIKLNGPTVSPSPALSEGFAADAKATWEIWSDFNRALATKANEAWVDGLFAKKRFGSMRGTVGTNLTIRLSRAKLDLVWGVDYAGHADSAFEAGSSKALKLEDFLGTTSKSLSFVTDDYADPAIEVVTSDGKTNSVAFADDVSAVAVAATNYTDAAANATLAAANAYTDAHAGTGGLSTNAVLALIEDSVGGTNAVRAAVAHTAVGPTWMRPNAWRLTATPTRDVAEIAAVYFSTNNYRTYSNEVARVITTRSAQLRGERLDRYAIDPLIVTNFAAVTPGCSVDELGYVTAEADGQYRVAGTDSTGETRYCDIWFSAGIRDTVLNTIYVGDLAPHLAAANDAALGVLANAALVGTYTVAGKTCNQYSTIAPAFAKSGAHGYYNPWAVSPHVLMTAGHMGYLGNRGPISYGGHTVNRVRAVWLKDWALTNGFTEAEVNAVSMIGDIEMIVCDNSGALPAEILPTFISPEKFAARFPGGLNGAVVWSANQHHADMVPRVARNDHGYYLYGDADFAAYPARADLAGRLAAMGQQHIFHGGDSGHVVFLRDDGYDIPITQYYSASTGPDLIAAFPMIKAFVESLGDTLKEVE